MCLVKPAEAPVWAGIGVQECCVQEGLLFLLVVLPSVTLGLKDKYGHLNIQVHPSTNQANDQHRPWREADSDLEMVPVLCW